MYKWILLLSLTACANPPMWHCNDNWLFTDCLAKTNSDEVCAEILPRPVCVYEG